MAKEARARDVYLDELPESEAGPDPESDEFASMLVLLRGWGLDEAGSILVLRNRVLGEPLAEIAEQLGITEEALQMRRCRAEERIRQRLLVTTEDALISPRKVRRHPHSLAA